VAGGRREANGGFPLPDSIPYHLPPAASRLAVARKPEAGSRKPEAGSRKPEAGSRKPVKEQIALRVLSSSLHSAHDGIVRSEARTRNDTMRKAAGRTPRRERIPSFSVPRERRPYFTDTATPSSKITVLPVWR
jgi:hypothetical protein